MINAFLIEYNNENNEKETQPKTNDLANLLRSYKISYNNGLQDRAKKLAKNLTRS